MGALCFVGLCAVNCALLPGTNVFNVINIINKVESVFSFYFLISILLAFPTFPPRAQDKRLKVINFQSLAILEIL